MDMNEIIEENAYLSLAPVGGRVRLRLARAWHNLQKEILKLYTKLVADI